MVKILEHRFVKLTLKFLFSHVGLFILVASYCIGGGFLLRHLELENEMTWTEMANESAETIANSSVNLKSKILGFVEMCKGVKIYQDLDVTKVPYGSLEDNCTKGKEFIRDQLTSFNKLIFEEMNKTNGTYRGDLIYPVEVKQWTVASSILFTASILTTIGYGHIAPKTQVGQLTVILYSLMAIPLMSIFLVNYGSMFGEFLFFLYQKTCCRPLNKTRAKVHEAHGIIPINAFDTSEKSTIVSSDVYFSSSDTGDILDEGKQPDLQEEKDGVLEFPKHVPASLALMVAAAVCLLGVFVFSISEGWRLIPTFYFTFVTLCTIGFGDLVPGWQGAEVSALRMSICAIYAVLGLSISAMVIKMTMYTMMDYAQQWSIAIKNQVEILNQKSLKKI